MAITRIFSDPSEINRKADEAYLKGLQKQFPVENKEFILDAHNWRVERKPFSMEDEKEAILKSKSLTYPVKADLVLIRKSDGKIVDKQDNFTVADSFHITSKGTILYKGSNYSISNQLQLMPGVYTRTNDIGGIESHVNVGVGSGVDGFTVTLDPKNMLFYLKVGSANIPAAPLITNVLGLTDAEVEKYVPKEIWEANKNSDKNKPQKVVADLYARLVSNRMKKKGTASYDEMVHILRDCLTSSKLSERTTSITLGKPISTVTPEAMLLTLKNIINVQRGDREEDNRDSLAFKKVQNLPDYIDTMFERKHTSINNARRKMVFGLDRIDPNKPLIRSESGTRGSVISKPFNSVYTDYIVRSSLINTPSETNPLESIEGMGKVTLLGAGEGGIGNERGVPITARNIDPSHLGILDPSRTPESGHVGIDLRFTSTAARDDEGNLYLQVTDNSGKRKHISVQEMMTSVVGFPHQEGKDVVEVQDHGVLKKVPRKSVQYWIPSATDMYTVTSNLVPFLNNNSPG